MDDENIFFTDKEIAYIKKSNSHEKEKMLEISIRAEAKFFAKVLANENGDYFLKQIYGTTGILKYTAIGGNILRKFKQDKKKD